jgi:tetratricopeptide (TPR) repeat protein
MTPDWATVLDGLESRFQVADAGPPESLLPAVDAILAELASVPYDVLPGRRIRLLMDAGSRYYVEGSDVARAAPSLALAVLLAERHQELPALRRALSIQSLVRSSVRDFAGALQSAARAADIAHRLRQSHGLAAAWVNIGSIYNEVALYDDARRACQNALRIAQSVEPALRADFMPQALHGYAVACLSLSDNAAALAATERAIAEVGEPSTHFQEVIVALALQTAAHALLASNRVAEAAIQNRRGRELASRSGSLRAISACQITEGLILVYQGKVDAGMSTLREAENTNQLPGGRLDYLKAMIRAQERAGHFDAALKAYRDYVSEVHRNRVRSFSLSTATATNLFQRAADPAPLQSDRHPETEAALVALADRVRHRLGSSSQLSLFIA